MQLSVERCEGAPFDVEAYAHAVEVELIVLNAASLVPGAGPDGAAGPQLDVRLPGCAEELQVTLRWRDREASEALRASDYAGLGQPRALALATIELLRVLSLRLQAAASSPASPPASDEAASQSTEDTPPQSTESGSQTPAESPPPSEAVTGADDAAAPAVDREQPAPAPASGGPPPWLLVYARGGPGLGGALDARVHAGAALALWPAVWARAELGYGHALERTSLGALLAHEASLGALLELRLRPIAPLELSAVAGLRGSLVWVKADLERMLAPGLSTSTVLAPLAQAVIELGVAVELAENLLAGVYIEPGLALAGARFAGATAAELGVTGGNAEPPRIELLGLSLYAGLMFGYRF